MSDGTRPVKLSDLDPRWFAEHNKIDGVTVETIVGLTFECPVDEHCAVAAQWAGRSKPHWKKSGDTFETLTIKPSINQTVSGQCSFHGFVRNGVVTWLPR